ncbi:MAG: hypothetical protein NVS9B7_18140 [Flavisolibacter sp.]
MAWPPLIIEQTYNAPVGKVWQAISDPIEMKQWYFDIPNFKPEVDFEFSFIGENEGRKFIHLCKILEVIPNRKLSYSWRYQDFGGSSKVNFELSGEGLSTTLRLVHEGLESFPKTKDFARDNFYKGWTHLLGLNLTNFMALSDINS